MTKPTTKPLSELASVPQSNIIRQALSDWLSLSKETSVVRSELQLLKSAEGGSRSILPDDMN